MTSLLSPVSPVGAVSRDSPAPSVTQGAPRPAAPLESARAPRPVDPAGLSEKARNQNMRDRPVGPPPSFDVNVLEDIRARLADSAAQAPRSRWPADTGTASADDAALEPAGDSIDAPPPHLQAQTTPPPRHLDKKV